MHRLNIHLPALRKAIILGWAVAVIWIYLGNLVNFHQNRIWGKQLIPAACSSTRGKEKTCLAFVKNSGNPKSLESAQHFDFTSPVREIDAVETVGIIPDYYLSASFPIKSPGFDAWSLRGPPSI